MSPQRPVYRAYEQNPEKVAREKTFPQIQARAKKEGAAIFFADESSVRTNYHAGTTWAPTGKTLVVKGGGKTRSISMVSAVSPRGELHFEIQDEGIKSEDFLAFARKLIADTGRPVFLILDNSQVHRAIILKEYAAQSNGMLTLFFLPHTRPILTLMNGYGRTSSTTTSAVPPRRAPMTSPNSPAPRSTGSSRHQDWCAHSLATRT